jgi:hypothetical protein
MGPARGPVIRLLGGLREDRYEEWVAHRDEELRSEFLALLEEQVALLESPRRRTLG